MWYYENEESLNLDIAMIKKFSRLNVTAPLTVTDLDKTVKELEDLK
jgi:hypothetical protein